jgi:hypothetical protein
MREINPIQVIDIHQLILGQKGAQEYSIWYILLGILESEDFPLEKKIAAYELVKRGLAMIDSKMSRKEICENFGAVLLGSKRVEQLMLNDGTYFQSDVLIFEADEEEGVFVAFDDDHDGVMFTVDDIISLEVC